MTFLDYLPTSDEFELKFPKLSQAHTARCDTILSHIYLLVKGGSFSECFSLWLFPQENVPNHYPQLFTLGWKVEGSNWLTNKKAFEKCAALCSTAHFRLGLLKVKTKSTSSPPSSNFKWSSSIKFYWQTRPNLCVPMRKVWKKVWNFFLIFLISFSH